MRRVVEMAGMLDHCDFFTQTTLYSEEGRQRPDLLVRLPAGKTLVVDAKTPLDGYLQAIDAADEVTRKARLADHARQVRAHMASLGRKSYWEQFDQAPEFAVLFLPGVYRYAQGGTKRREAVFLAGAAWIVAIAYVRGFMTG